MDIKDILGRVGYVRNKAKLSAREVSLRIGMSYQYVTHLETGRITLSVEKLLAILEVCDFPVEKFFYSSPEDFEKDRELMALIKALPSEKKGPLIELLKK